MSKSIELTYFQTEMCKVIVKSSHVSCGIRDLRVIQKIANLFTEKLDEVGERPKKPMLTTDTPSDEEKDLFTEDLKNWRDKVDKINKKVFTFKLSKEQYSIIRQKLSNFKRFNPETEWAFNQMIELGDIFEI